MDSAIGEMSEAFDGLQNKDVWLRAHPRWLSVGELAAHVAFGEARWMYPELTSPVVSELASFDPSIVDKPFSLEMGAQALYAEGKRVHTACKSHVLEMKPDLESKLPEREDWTWGYTMQYMAFHIAYHRGQMYSVRHLLEHDTADN